MEKLEANRDVQFAVVLFTADDEGRVRAKAGVEIVLTPRARQNVVLELGYFMGYLGREKVAVIYEEGVEMPSDYSGVEYVALDKSGAWKQKLAQELGAAGLALDPDWFR